MSSGAVPIDTLPEIVRIEDAVEAACAADIAFVEERLMRGSSVLVECDKELSLYLYLALRGRLKRRTGAPKLTIIDGRPKSEAEAAVPRSALARMLDQLIEAIRGSVERNILVLMHLDVLTTTHTGLTAEAREAIPLLYENPEVLLLGFRDPSFEIPKVIRSVFAAHRAIEGIPRESLPKLVTRREARAIEAEVFRPFALYKYVSGLNPVRCRRVLEALAHRREAIPGRPPQLAVFQEIRQQTAGSDLELPNVDLERDVAGYDEVKQRLREELIDLARRKETLTSDLEVATVEDLLPRGVIFHGPPGTGKTYFAKAIATALDATILIVSGPELKSMWVGQSEENLRRIFRTARQSAPSVIVFDEIDAFASARGTYVGSGVEHSMVNQLLTEMDGFRKNEMVFVIGTTNLLSSVDGALLRPGRFEFLIEVPAPSPEDREAIARLYDKRYAMKLDDKLFAHIVRRTEGLADVQTGSPFTGDHIHALFRALMRQKIRTGQSAFSREDIDRALERKTSRPVSLSDEEERVVAVHEAGHALLAMLIREATPPERISVAQDREGALGYVLRAVRSRPYTLTASEMRADICVGLGGLAAERMCFGEPSVGAQADLQSCLRISRAMVEEYGMDAEVGVYVRDLDPRADLASESRRAKIEAAIDRTLRTELARAESLLHEHRSLHEALVALLLEHKVLHGETLARFVSGAPRSS